MSALERAIGHRFSQPELLETALTHTSHAHEVASREHTSNSSATHNEQLEFLGDAVLGLIASAELLRRFPEYQEGQLSKLRAHLVSERHLLKTANALHLGSFLKLGRGEDKSGGRTKPALLVDALEAVFGAMYLDGGMEDARQFIISNVIDAELAANGTGTAGMPGNDFKSALQERAHALGRPQPEYGLILEEGPEHQKTFTVEARIRPIDGRSKPEFTTRAQGTTKKRAEQEAARLALEKLNASAEAKSEPSADTAATANISTDRETRSAKAADRGKPPRKTSSRKRAHK